MAKKTQIIIEIDAKGTPKLKGQTKAVKDQTKALRDQGKTTKTTEKKARSYYQRQEKGVIGVANSTKNFSKMQQTMDGGGGAGGLVRAYALLAANVFALSMAFGVLSRSAQVDTLTASMEQLEIVSGRAIRGMAKNLQEASGYGMDFADSMRATSLALSAGFDTSTIERLAEVARNASVSLGRNMADGLDRIFRGVIKVEPELLDEIGLFVRVREAAAKYASELGLSAADLTEFQRRQAFANEALRQGEQKFQDFADIPTDPFAQLAAKFSDIAQQLMTIMNKVIVPFIDIITASKGVLMAVFLGIAGALLKKALPAMGLMTRSAAEQAAEAKKAHHEFLMTVDTKANAKRNEMIINRTAHLEQMDNIRAEMNLEARAVIARGSRKVAGGLTKIEAKIAKAKTADLGKAINVEKLLTLEKAKQTKLELTESKATGDNLISASAELDIQKQITAELEERLVAMQLIERAQLDNIKFGVKEGAQADTINKKLTKRETLTGGYAMAVTEAETKGMGAGFTALKDKQKEFRDEFKKTGKGLNAFERGAFRVKGSLKVLGVGMQNLMMKMGPLIMIFSMLTPVFIGIGKAMGFFSKESEAYKKAQEATAEAVEMLNKKMEHQLKHLRMVNQTMINIIEVRLAYKESILAVLVALEQEAAAEELAAKKRSKWMSRLDNYISRRFAFKTGVVEAVIPAAAEAKDDPFPKVEGGADAFDSFRKSIDKLLITGYNYVQLSKEMAALFPKLPKELSEEIGNFETELKTLETALSNVDVETGKELGLKAEFEDAKFALMGMTRGTWQHTAAQKKVMDIEAQITANKERQTEVGQSLTDLYVERLKVLLRLGLSQKKVTEELTKEQQAEKNLASIREGAKESLSEFRDQFIQKSDVDKPLASFRQLAAAIVQNDEKMRVTTEARNAELLEMATGESNLLLLMSIKNQIAFKTQKLGETEEEFMLRRISIIRKTLKWFEKGQFIQLRSKAQLKEISTIQNLIKENTKHTYDALKLKYELEKKSRAIQKEVLDYQYEAALLASGMTEARVDELLAVDNIKTLIEEVLAAGVGSAQAIDLINRYYEKQTSLLKDLFAGNTAANRLEKDRAELAKRRLEIQEKLNQSQLKGFQLQQKLRAFETRGTTALTPIEEIRALMQAETVRQKNAELRKSLEEIIIRMKWAIIEEEWRLLNEKRRDVAVEDARMAKRMAIENIRAAGGTDEDIAKWSKEQSVSVGGEKIGGKWLDDAITQAINKTYASSGDASAMATALLNELDLVSQAQQNSADEYAVAIRTKVGEALKQTFSTEIMNIEDTNLYKMLEQLDVAKLFRTMLPTPESIFEEFGSGAHMMARKMTLEQKQKKPGGLSPEEDTELVELIEKLKLIQEAYDTINTEGARNEINALSAVMMNFANSVRELGPDGVFAATFAEFTVSFTQGFQTMSNRLKDLSDVTKTYITDGKDQMFTSAADAEAAGAEVMDSAEAKSRGTIEKLSMASSAISGIASLMAAKSAAQVAGIDKEIDAEKKRDGKSKESLAKIKKLEDKKDAIKRKAFEANKKMMMAQVIIDTAAGIMKTIGETGFFGIPLAAIIGVMGAMNLALIAGTSYQGGGGTAPEASTPASITVGKRTNKVDVSQKASAGELAYLRGERGIGTTATNFIAQGGAAGLRKGYAGGKKGMQGFLVGERGPEMMQTASPFNVVPSYAMGGGAPGGVVSFTINAIDAAGVEEVLMAQQGNIISMIRTAANDYGEEFLEAVNTDTYGDDMAGTPQSGGGIDY